MDMLLYLVGMVVIFWVMLGDPAGDIVKVIRAIRGKD